jgi:hypothetical protein
VRCFDLLPSLFAAQLLVFFCQETIESWAAGGHIPSMIELLLWGTLGQLPAAVVAAAAVSWLLTRLEDAWTVLVEGAIILPRQPSTPALDEASRPEPSPARRLGCTFPSAFQKRGPPRLLATIAIVS